MTSPIDDGFRCLTLNLQGLGNAWFDARHLPGALASCEEVLRRVPAAVLEFRPEAAALDAVERLLDAGREDGSGAG